MKIFFWMDEAGRGIKRIQREAKIMKKFYLLALAVILTVTFLGSAAMAIKEEEVTREHPVFLRLADGGTIDGAVTINNNLAVTGAISEGGQLLSAKYALKSEIPDLTQYLTKTAAGITYALKSELPDLTPYLTKTAAANTYVAKTGTNLITDMKSRRYKDEGSRVWQPAPTGWTAVPETEVAFTAQAPFILNASFACNGKQFWGNDRDVSVAIEVKGPGVSDIFEDAEMLFNQNRFVSGTTIMSKDYSQSGDYTVKAVTKGDNETKIALKRTSMNVMVIAKQ